MAEEKAICKQARDRVNFLESQERKTDSSFMKAVYRGRIKLMKRFQNRACGVKVTPK